MPDLKYDPFNLNLDTLFNGRDSTLRNTKLQSISTPPSNSLFNHPLPYLPFKETKCKTKFSKIFNFCMLDKLSILFNQEAEEETVEDAMTKALKKKKGTSAKMAKVEKKEMVGQKVNLDNYRLVLRMHLRLPLIKTPGHHLTTRLSILLLISDVI
jgi:hypothetical protein